MIQTIGGGAPMCSMVKIVHRCGSPECDAVVPARGDFCPSCGERYRREVRENLLRAACASLPDWPEARFEHPSFGKRVSAKIAKAATDWRSSSADGATNNLTLLGTTGVGKTTAAVAICRRILDIATTKDIPSDKFTMARGIRWAKARHIATSSRKWRLGDGDAPELAEALKAPLLVLDELGKEARPRDAEEDAIASMLDDRYERKGFVTIVTSNLTLGELGDRYGHATRRRFTTHGALVEVFG